MWTIFLILDFFNIIGHTLFLRKIALNTPSEIRNSIYSLISSISTLVVLILLPLVSFIYNSYSMFLAIIVLVIVKIMALILIKIENIVASKGISEPSNDPIKTEGVNTI